LVRASSPVRQVVSFKRAQLGTPWYLSVINPKPSDGGLSQQKGQMGTPTIDRRQSRGAISRGMAAVLLAALLYLLAMGGPASKASAGVEENFCTEVTLSPYGHYGDHCYAWVWQAHVRLLSVKMMTYERAGCVSYAGPEGYTVQDSWVCIGNYSQTLRYVRNDGASHRGVIRNNNLSYSGRFNAGQICCYP